MGDFILVRVFGCPFSYWVCEFKSFYLAGGFVLPGIILQICLNLLKTIQLLRTVLRADDKLWPALF